MCGTSARVKEHNGLAYGGCSVQNPDLGIPGTGLFVQQKAELTMARGETGVPAYSLEKPDFMVLWYVGGVVEYPALCLWKPCGAQCI